MNNTESFIQVATRSLYAFQTQRIQSGNRLVAAFRHKLGLASSQPEEDEADASKLLNELRKEYARITDGVKKITKNMKIDSPLITNVAEAALIEAYELQLQVEKTHEKALDYYLAQERIWNEHLKQVKGVGPLMAGVILSEIDITKCNSPSALHSYCGLGVLTWFECKQKLDESAPDTLRKRHPAGFKTRGPAVVGCEEDWFLLLNEEGKELGWYGLPPEGTPNLGEGQCRKKAHLVPKTYTRADGSILETVGLSFHPFLKTKMVGVLGDVFIKMGGEYKAIYDTYKARISADPKHRESFDVFYDGKIMGTFYEEAAAREFVKATIAAAGTGKVKDFNIIRKGKTKAHIHAMSKRRMIKAFLTDTWGVWRELEGLPVVGSYAEDKLKFKKAA